MTGQAATLVFVFMESDDTDPGLWFKIAGEIAQRVGAGEPIVEIAGQILKWIGSLIPKNKDDVLGAFSLNLRNENGRLLVETSPGQFTTVLEGWNGQSGTFAYKFDHDDGVYQAYFRASLSQFPEISTRDKSTWYHLQSDINKLFLDVKGYEVRDNAQICAALRHPTQVWRLVPSRFPGYYHIEFKTASRFRNLDVFHGEPVEGGRICLAEVHDGQAWRLIHDHDDFFRLQSYKTGYYLDVFLAGQTPGTPICQTQGANAKQVWRFIPAE